MNAPKLALVRTREQTIEECLASLVPVMADKTISRQARDAAVVLQRELHKCRSPETVRRLERAIFDRLSPEDQALFLKSGGKL